MGNIEEGNKEKLAYCEQRLKSWEDEVSKEMPLDFKDWWQNSKEEWPLVCRLVLENRRKEIEELRKELDYYLPSI